MGLRLKLIFYTILYRERLLPSRKMNNSWNWIILGEK